YMGDDYVDAIATLREWGADGIEAYYKHYPPEVVEKHAELARKLGMGASGGSDYHGLGNPDDRDIGDFAFPDEAVEAFLAFLAARGVQTGKLR
ncbi:MAG: hypothetical protein ACRDG3_00230, partial [Tepidiformaceae bacterium]